MFGPTELETQKYLKANDIDALQKEFGIHVHRKDGLVILNYDQIDSPKTNSITMECRSLILKDGTWELVAKAFRRFFNLGEAPEHTRQFNWEKAHAVEKVDGSLMQLFFHEGKWRISTRGTIDAVGNVGFSNMTFAQLFHRVAAKYPGFWDGLNESFCYTFEIVSPENRVITPYEDELYLITARATIDGCFAELDWDILRQEASCLGIRLPKRYKINNADEVRELIENLHPHDEGFVVVDYSNYIHGVWPCCFLRIKIKSPSYLAMVGAKQRGNSLSSILELIVDNKQDDFLTLFPEYGKYFTEIGAKYRDYLAKVNQDIAKVQGLLGREKTPHNRKEYAMLVNGMTNPGFMFTVYDGRATTAQECVHGIKTSGRWGKKLLEVIGGKEKELTE